MQYNRLIVIARTAQTYFSEILSAEPQIFDDKVRLLFIDDSFMDIRYPMNSKYSFHWRSASNMFRVDTAPHHKNVSTYPRHIHIGDLVIADTLTSFDNTIEDNVKNVLNYVRRNLLTT
ncbi:MAG: DUF6516 family protein [Methanosarcinales archaeon]